MDDKILAKMLEEYNTVQPLYDKLARKVADLIEQMLDGKAARIHSIDARAKDKGKLKEKLKRPNKSYTKLTDVTDLAGIRITTYFAEDVDLLAPIIEQEFKIDREDSSDKRDLLDPDRFGYLSLHYVGSLSKARTQLVEYRLLDGLKFEIQIRSILQHAWAEIEHDLGYKSPQSIPKKVRRRFARLASLLELADAEFSAIRNDLTDYAGTVDRQILVQPESVELNSLSLASYIQNSNHLRDLDLSIAATENTIVEELALPETRSSWIERLLRRLLHLGITNIAQLDESIQRYYALIPSYASHWYEYTRSAKGKIMPGASILFLTYIIVAEKGQEYAVEFLRVDRNIRNDYGVEPINVVTTRMLDILKLVQGK